MLCACLKPSPCASTCSEESLELLIERFIRESRSFSDERTNNSAQSEPETDEVPLVDVSKEMLTIKVEAEDVLKGSNSCIDAIPKTKVEVEAKKLALKDVSRPR